MPKLALNFYEMDPSMICLVQSFETWAFSFLYYSEKPQADIFPAILSKQLQ